MAVRIANIGGAIAEMDVYDVIGDPYGGTHAADFVRELRDLKNVSKIILNVNSPGGFVNDALAIYNALQQHPASVEARVVTASSAASFVIMAAEDVRIARNGKIMIHDAHAFTGGNAANFRELADMLDEESNNIASIYAQKTGTSAEDWRKAMQANGGSGTTYRGQEAVDAKLADGVLASKQEQRVAALADDQPIGDPGIDLTAIKKSAVFQSPMPPLEALLERHSLRKAMERGGK